MASKEKGNCEICKSQISKYKCPKCVIRYCSVTCFQSHKESLCSRIISQSENKITNDAKSTNLLTKSATFDLAETEDRVSQETLQCLRENPDLLMSLENPHLRSLMTTLVTSASPAEDMERAMKEPIFLEFADQCLKVVDNNCPLKDSVTDTG
ncbi:zinc finger HIT domain-containing protein 3-like [Crassostrea virginica]